MRELWEEAALCKRSVRLLGLFDGRLWGTASKVHLVHLLFLVECDDFTLSPGVEVTDAGFFPPDRLRTPMRPGHERMPEVLKIVRGTATSFDPADATTMDLPMHQRPPG